MEVINISNNPSSINKFNKMIKEKDGLVMIYSDGCPHCVEMKPVWNKFVKNIKNNDNVFVSNIPSHLLGSLDVEQNIMGVPTIRLLKKGSGKRKSEYMKGPDYNSLMQFYNKLNFSKKGGLKKTNHTLKKNTNINRNNIMKYFKRSVNKFRKSKKKKSRRPSGFGIKKITRFFTRKHL